MSSDVEWSVLESIYPSICISNKDAVVSLLVPVELAHDIRLHIAASSLSLSSLPPIHLRIALPPSYPSRSPPTILSVQAASAWLPPSTLPIIAQRMIAMWSPGDDTGVLYTWVEWIRTGDFLTDIGLLAHDTHSIQYVPLLPSFPLSAPPPTLRLPHPSPQLLIDQLLAHISSAKSDQFAQTSYLCLICLSERKGIHCFALSCSHVFCKTCLVDMWSLHVKEGDVSRVACPHPDCGKTDVKDLNGPHEAAEDEVRAILSASDLTRWKWLCKKRDLERDPTMVHCPMEFCQEPVPKPKSDTTGNRAAADDESSWSQLRTCTACSYSFCALCRRTWHGPHTACPLPLTSKFIHEYLSTVPGSPQRRAIERRYGRGNVLGLVRRHEEEQENRKWMESSTMACPGCTVRVEKSIGCNHMTCTKCGTHFCYRCGTKLPGANPYQHFSAPHTPCFAKLFDVVPNAEEEWQPVEGFDYI